MSRILSLDHIPLLRLLAKRGRALALSLLLLPGGNSCLSQLDDQADSSKRVQAHSGDLRSKLLKSGVDVGGLNTVLTSPVMSSASASKASLDILEQVAGKVGWERFSRQNLNAPVIISIKEIYGTNSNKLGLSVHQTYIAYTKLEELKDHDLFESTFGTTEDDPTGAVIRELTEDEMQSNGIASSNSSPNFYWMELPVLRKIMIRGVLQIETIDAEDGIEIYWRLDPRFSASGQPADTPDTNAQARKAGGLEALLENTWSPLTTNDLGNLVEGDARPYQGMAGLMSVYATSLSKNQVLVESRMVLHEPEEWFGGSKYLRSKLLLSLQESAKSFRRKLRKQ